MRLELAQLDAVLLPRRVTPERFFVFSVVFCLSYLRYGVYSKRVSR